MCAARVASPQQLQSESELISRYPTFRQTAVTTAAHTCATMDSRVSHTIRLTAAGAVNGADRSSRQAVDPTLTIASNNHRIRPGVPIEASKRAWMKPRFCEEIVIRCVIESGALNNVRHHAMPLVCEQESLFMQS
jgi:hypothetical protein